MVVAVGGKKNTKQLDKVVISLLMVKKNTKQLNTGGDTGEPVHSMWKDVDTAELWSRC